jgi:phenylalanyl-tRNA synthetase beta chain
LRLPVSWLRDYVDVPSPLEEVANRLALATAEVDRIIRRGIPDTDGNLGLFKIGRVLEAGKHPNADRLQLCQVDVGEGNPRQIVCGAWNFGPGATVAVALPGAVLPDGRTLEKAKLRGTVSDGMILSEQELELGTDASGILVLEDGADPGTPLADVLPVVEEILEVEVTGNRPDLLSVYGMAREIAALYELELRPPPGAPELPLDPAVQVDVEDLEGCPRYDARLFSGVRIGPSPAWLRARLLAAGVRAISNVVDVTNYVMLGLGNPLHAFDHSKLAGGQIIVRRARPGEELTTLDGTRRKLDPADLVIADAKCAVAFAGIMGGLDTEIGDETTEVLLETANFEPTTILASSERHSLRTEGSNRWEKGVDPYLVPQAAALATKLLVELTGVAEPRRNEVVGTLPERPVIRFRPERTNRLVGIDVSETEQREILERLGFDVVDGWDVVVPTWRARDVTREVDLVEEVARIHGLDKVPFTLPLRSAMFGRLSREQRLRRVVEDVLVGCGLSEAYTWSLARGDINPDALRLPVPISAEHAVLRTSLLEGLLDAARLNVDAGNKDIRLFEIARVYLPTDEDLPDERWHVGAVLEGGFSAAKGVVETLHSTLHVEARFERGSEPFLHPGKSARVESGWLGEVHPNVLEGGWGAFELDLETLFAGIPERIHYEDVITYPAVHQDLAFVVPEEVLAGDLVAAAHKAAGPELREAKVFDVYRGGQIPEGKKSIALSVAFQSPERTLADEDARSIRERIVAALAERFGAELRA